MHKFKREKRRKTTALLTRHCRRLYKLLNNALRRNLSREEISFSHSIVNSPNIYPDANRFLLTMLRQDDML
jgi:hypothetical protein